MCIVIQSFVIFGDVIQGVIFCDVTQGNANLRGVIQAVRVFIVTVETDVAAVVTGNAAAFVAGVAAAVVTGNSAAFMTVDAAAIETGVAAWFALEAVNSDSRFVGLNLNN